MVCIDKELCVGCGKCCKDCVSFALELKDKKAYMTKEQCLLCGHCVAICPEKAVTIDEYDMNEVIEYNQDTFCVDEEVMLNSIKFRRSVRSYKDQKVEKESIKNLIEAGRYSPTGSNSQNVSYIVIQEELPKIREEANKAFRRLILRANNTAKAPSIFDRIDMSKGDYLFKGAPAIILVVSDSEVNASIASVNMEHVAISQGLGMLYVGFFVRIVNHNKKLKQMIGLSDKQKVITCLAIGYPNVIYKRTAPRKKAEVQWK